MIKRTVLSVIGALLIYVGVCLYVIYEENGKWDACDEQRAVQKFAPSAHTYDKC